jgi:hypothetical protein
VHNYPELNRLVAAAAVDLLGEPQVEWLEQPSLGADEVCRFSTPEVAAAAENIKQPIIDHCW